MNGRSAAVRGRWPRAVALALALGAAATTLTACGSGGEVTYAGGTFDEVTPGATARAASADEVRGKKLAVEGMELLRTADTVRMGVDMTTPKGHQKVTLHMDRDSNCIGTFDAGPMQRGELIVVDGGTAYVRFSDASLDAIRDMAELRGPDAAATIRERTALARGKYLKIPAGTDSSRAVPGMKCDLDELTDKMVGGPDEGDVIKALPETRRYGRSVTPLVETEGGGDGEETTVYVAASGRPYILGVEGIEDGGQTMSMRMSAYDEPVVAKAPAAALTIDISRIRGGGALFEV
ncbi:hypothetical protein H9W91_23480 [Streptomyces alfalfae]|uniref:hypothetical protein n=1 Tax=Streptomyces alfalfae TaxID=1642299 RepID=UPI001BA44A35|nr:hypothetical protein [Streptomyces alfalfae]QUI33492.1 hypothetical protein H9W91_23480 [Streptomyces alfalfae]